MKTINHSFRKMLLLPIIFTTLASSELFASLKEQVAQATKDYAATHVAEKKVFDDLVNVASEMPTVVLDIRYATDNNFTAKTAYTQAACYLRRAAVEKLKLVQEELKLQGLGLKIFDAYRPYDVQGIFWKLFPDPRYVADPPKGSKHNRGAAVDLTLIKLATGEELDMPSVFDDFTEKAHRNYDAMTPVAAKNCKLLEDAMTKYGFTGLPTEWWHFDFNGWQQYPLLNISFETLATN